MALVAMTATPSAAKTHLSEKFLRTHAEQLKERYPAMPGVAFYQHTRDEDTQEFRELFVLVVDLRS